MVHGPPHPHLLQQADGHEVARLAQRLAQGGGAETPAAVVARPPLAADARILIHHRRVVDHARGGKPVGYRGGIDERFETGAGLALSLRDAVEFAAVVIQPAGQRQHRAAVRLRGDKGPLRRGTLRQQPVAALVLRNAHDIARTQELGGRRRRLADLVDIDIRLGPAQPRPLNVDGADVGQIRRNRVFPHADHQGRIQRPHGMIRRQQLSPFLLAGLRRQLVAMLGAAVAVPPVVFEQGFLQGVVGGALVPVAHGGGDDIAGRVGFIAVFLDQADANHLGDIRRLQPGVGAVQGGRERRRGGLLELLAADFAGPQHALQHMVASFQRRLRVADRVAGRRRFGQPGDHGVLRQAKPADVRAVVDLRRRADAVSALAEIDLVDIQLQNLLLVEFFLDLHGEEDLVQFADIGSLPAQEEISGDLHGDRAAALADLAARHEQADGGAHQPFDVHSGMLVEALVLGGDEGLEQPRRRVFDGYRYAFSLAVFGDQGAVFMAVDAQRHLHTHIAQTLDIGQSGDDDQRREGHEHDAGDAQQGDAPQEQVFGRRLATLAIHGAAL